MLLHKSLKWDILDRCNLRCAHCSVADRYFNATDKPEPLSLDDRRQVAMAIIKGGVRHVSLLGGEPLLLGKEVFDLLELFKTHGLSISLVTNGVLIDAAAMKELVRIGPDRLVFSMEGPDAATHDQMRGQGNFHKLVKVITSLKSLIVRQNAAISLHINTVVTRRNMHHIAGMIPHALAIGADELSLLGLNCVGNAARQQHLLALRIQDELMVAREIADAHAQPQNARLRLNLNFIYPLVRDYLLVHENRRLPSPQICCGAAYTLAHVNPWGEMHPCDRIYISGHDRRFRSPAAAAEALHLTRKGFYDVWNSDYFLNTFTFVTDQASYENYDPCMRCTYFHQKKCTPCPLDVLGVTRFPIESCLRIEQMAGSDINTLITRARERDEAETNSTVDPAIVPVAAHRSEPAPAVHPHLTIRAEKGVRLTHLKAQECHLLIHPRTGEGLFLDDNGQRLWQLMAARPQTIADICRQYGKEITAATWGIDQEEISATVETNSAAMIRVLMDKQYLVEVNEEHLRG